MINTIKINILKNKGLIVIVLLVLSLLVPSILLPSSMEAAKKNDALGLAAKANLESFSEPTETPTTTVSAPTTTIPQAVVATLTLTPTLTPTPVPVTTTTVASLTTTTTTNTTTTSTTIPSPALTLTDVPTPTPHGLQVQIGIDYAGQKTSDSYTATVGEGQSAWDAVISAVGISNLQYTDYGGDMGIFITGFNGINASSNQYFEFRVNGVSSNAGVSSYKCSDGGKLDFVLTSF